MPASYIKNKKGDCKSECPIKFEKKARMACSGRAMTVDLRNNEINAILQGEAIDLNSVTIDLEGLISPLVKIDFSAVVELEGDTLGIGNFPLTFGLQFILSRICEDGVEQELETYDYVRDFSMTDTGTTPVLFVSTTDPVSFTFCDCVNSCSDGACTYIVRVFVPNFSEFNIQEAKIDDIFINAIAQGTVAH